MSGKCATGDPMEQDTESSEYDTDKTVSDESLSPGTVNRPDLVGRQIWNLARIASYLPASSHSHSNGM